MYFQILLEMQFSLNPVHIDEIFSINYQVEDVSVCWKIAVFLLMSYKLCHLLKKSQYSSQLYRMLMITNPFTGKAWFPMPAHLIPKIYHPFFVAQITWSPMVFISIV